MKGYTSATPLFDARSPTKYECGCTAAGDLVAASCPMHGHPEIAPVDPHVRTQDAPRLSRNNRAVLARLQQGPATTIELMGPNLGGIRPGARVFDLCEAGCRIKSERIENGVALYTLLECPENLS